MPTTDELNNLINQRVSELTGRMDAFTVSVSAIDDKSEYAIDRADFAISQLYSSSVEGQAYTDRRINDLRNELLNRNWTLQDSAVDDLISTLTDQLTGTINDGVRDARAAADAAAGVSSAVTAEQVAIRNALSTALDVELALQRQRADDALDKSRELELELFGVTEGMETLSIQETLDRMTEQFNEALRAAHDGTLRLPASNWTLDPANEDITALVPPAPSMFSTEDNRLGDVLVAPLNQALRVGASYPMVFEKDELYRITVHLRYWDMPPDGQSRISIGARTWVTTTNTTENQEIVAHAEQAVQWHPFKVTAYVTADADLASRVDGPCILLTASNNADRFRGYLSIPSDAGSLRVHKINVEEYTPLVRLQDYSDTAFEETDRRINEISQNLDDAINGTGFQVGGNWTFRSDWSGWTTTADLTKHPKECTEIEIGQILEDTNA